MVTRWRHVVCVASVLSPLHCGGNPASTDDIATCTAGDGAEACEGAASHVEALLKWAADNGASGIEALEIRMFNKSGPSVRGVAATRKLEWGETAFRIPEYLILTRHHPLVLASPFHRAKEDTKNAAKFKMSLSGILYFAAERRKVAEGGASFWAPYIRSLPSPEALADGHPAYTSSELVDSFKKLPIIDRITATQNTIKDTWEEHVEEWIGLAEEAGIPNFAFEDFKWAVVLANSRSFTTLWGQYGHTRYKPGLAMVPIADMFNHEERNNVEWFKELRGKPPMWEERLERTVQAGKELTHTYGSESPNDELFVRYGFLLARNGNKMKVVREYQWAPQKSPLKGLCKPKRVAKLMEVQAESQQSILIGLKSLLQEYCAGLPSPNRPAPPPR